jgi:ketosteroid isomerase-like protein
VPRIGVQGEIEAEIVTSTERFHAALTRRDGSGAAAVYGEDALLLPPAGDVIRGRGAIGRFWSGGIEVGLRAVELERLGRGGTGSIVYEHGGYRMLLVHADGRSKVERGPYVVVHVRSEDGSWRWAVNTFGTPAE